MTKNNLKYPKHIIRKHLTIDAVDEPDYNIKQHFKESGDFIEKWLRHGNVYVHCEKGISRSTAVVIAYLIKFK
jgi:protein-tyrosine phosphatase